MPEPADVSGVISEFVGRGVSPHSDRASLAREVEPGPQAAAVGKVMRSLQTVAECPPVPRAELFAAWPRILDPDGQDITVEDAALAVMSLLDIQIRDAMVTWLCPGTLGLDEFSEDIQKLFCGLEKGRGEETYRTRLNRLSERPPGPSNRPLHHAARRSCDPCTVGSGLLCLVAWRRCPDTGCPGPSPAL